MVASESSTVIFMFQVNENGSFSPVEHKFEFLSEGIFAIDKKIEYI